jgi:heavy metal sensor kinase
VKSIRLSLVFYFLALLALALGAASVLAFRTAHQTLLAKRDATRQLLDAQFEERSAKAKANLDDALLYQAQTLARLVQFQTPGRLRTREFNTPVGLFTSGFVANGHFLTAAWIAEGAQHSPVAVAMFQKLRVAEIRFDENELPPEEGTYFQINSIWGSTYRSKSLGKRVLPAGPDMFTQDQAQGQIIDDVRLVPDGTPVHRVLFKVSTTWGGFPPRRTAPRGRGKPAAPDPEPPPMTIHPTIAIQCASDKSRLDATVAELRAGYEADLARLDEATNDSLMSLRNHLLAIALATFAASALGGFALVRLGLAPLSRLSDAVSRVSAKDFRLPFDKRRVPAELTVIVDRLNQTLDMLKRAFAREKQAAADISHELRTPLAALLTTIDVGLRKPRSGDEYRELLGDCRESGRQMSRLVERLLILSRLDAGVDTLRPQQVDVADLAEQCAALVRPLAEARALSLRVHAAGPAELRADPDKLREVLTNLLHNAIQYNRPDGSIDVTVARHNGSLRLEVSDTGIGMAPEARAHIFERFYRADPSRHTDDMHAGLGLAIVKGYVDLMGGTIAVSSAEGQGSTFRVELPATPGQGTSA